MRGSAPHANCSLQDQDYQAAAHAAQAQGHHILQQQSVLSAHVLQIWCQSKAGASLTCVPAHQQHTLLANRDTS